MKQLYFSYTIDAPIDQVWQMISTVEGIRTYMSEDCKVEPVVGGTYEVYFDMSMPEGLRGSEGMRILCIEPLKRFGHTWNNPPSLQDIRGQQTAVYYELSQDMRGMTQLDFYHLGFGDSEDWQQSYEYFARAWGEIVLPRLVKCLEGE